MTRARRTRILRRTLAGLAGFAMLAGVALAPSAENTEAGWTDAEVGATQFAAATMPTPIPWGAAPQCDARNRLLVGGRITIRWRLPEGTAGYTADNIEFGQEIDGVLDPILSGLLGSHSTTGTPSGYTTVVSGGLLSNLLGGSSRFALRLTGPGDWVSPWLVADVTIPPLVGNGTCSLSSTANG